jgi:broad specificity phosphatase PhoE
MSGASTKNGRTYVAFMRHGPTAWNGARRLQGRADIEITPRSQHFLEERRLPREFGHFRVLCSPLRRCRQTAEILGLNAEIEPRLIEMDWGEFEGHTIEELRVSHNFDFVENEKRGLDFQPPGGESPRMVQERVAPLLREIALEGLDTLCVTHRGIFRAVYARARNWDMIGPPPDKLDLYSLHVFALDADGTPHVEALNLALKRRWLKS